MSLSAADSCVGTLVWLSQANGQSMRVRWSIGTNTGFSRAHIMREKITVRQGFV